MALPESLRRRSDREAIQEDLEPYRGTSIEERAELISALCKWAAEQIASRPDGQRILDFQEPLSPRSRKLWAELVAQFQRL